MLIIEFATEIITEEELNKILQALPDGAIIRSPIGNELKNIESVLQE